MLKIFVPAYNEEKVIETNIRNIHDIITKKFKDFRLYLVDDGSTDSTHKIGKNINLKNYKYLRCGGPSRRENLVQSMVKFSNKEDIVCFIDADRSTGEEALDYAIEKMKDYDIVIGSRYVKGSKIKRKLDRRIISFLFNKFVRIYFRSKIRDHECGFKLFKAKVLKELVNEMGINHERKMFWDSEMLIRAQRKGFHILEIPVRWIEGPKSALGFKKELPMIKYILKLRFRL